MSEDKWRHRTAEMRCQACMYFVAKIPIDDETGEGKLGRCRRNAPTMKGWPVMFRGDWCGEHKLDENKI